MSDPTAELVEAIEAALRADTALPAAFPGGKVQIHDTPPSNAPFPYITLPDIYVLSQGAQGFDGSEASLSLHVWSRPDALSTAQARGIVAALVAALESAALAMASFRAVQLRWDDTRALPDLDGETQHYVVRFVLSADPT